MNTINYKEVKNSDDPQTFVEGYVKQVAKNAALIAKFPFLLPLNYHGKMPKDYDFTFTELDNLPSGWHKLMTDMSLEIITYLNSKGISPYTFHIDQLKEKFGGIRLYYSIHCTDKFEFDDEGIDEIIHKYEALSEHTCCECGKKATLYSTGWICPYCNECAKKLILNGMKMDFVSITQKEQENAQQI